MPHFCLSGGAALFGVDQRKPEHLDDVVDHWLKQQRPQTQTERFGARIGDDEFLGRYRPAPGQRAAHELANQRRLVGVDMAAAFKQFGHSPRDTCI